MAIPAAVRCLPREFLVNGGSLSELERDYAIEIRRHGLFTNLVQLKYNQIASPFSEPIVCGCRGLILDQDDDWRIIAWPFNKFFNHGEPLAAPIDWPSARVQEKLDGSLMILYWYDGQWRVATSGMPDAAGLVHGTHMPFVQLFWDTWYRKKMELPSSIHQCYTFMFELTSPLNRVVVSQTAPDLRLIGMRSIWSGVECPIAYRATYNPVKEFQLASIEDVLSTFAEMDPLRQEGYVIVDGNFNRVKVKHPGYVALHHLKSSFSVRRLVEVIRRGEAAEVLVHFPEWKRPFEQVQAAYDGLVIQLEQDYEEIKAEPDRKTFALAVKTSPHPASMFMLRDGKCASVKESLQNIHIDKMLDVLGVRGLVLDGAI